MHRSTARNVRPTDYIRSDCLPVALENSRKPSTHHVKPCSLGTTGSSVPVPQARARARSLAQPRFALAEFASRLTLSVVRRIILRATTDALAFDVDGTLIPPWAPARTSSTRTRSPPSRAPRHRHPHRRHQAPRFHGPTGEGGRPSLPRGGGGCHLVQDPAVCASMVGFAAVETDAAEGLEILRASRPTRNTRRAQRLRGGPRHRKPRTHRVDECATRHPPSSPRRDSEVRIGPAW